MKLQLDKLILKNFLSFEYAELQLSRNGYVIVNGVNENPDDLARSNGSGKSSLWEAISWCLTGETIRGTKDVRRIGSEDECEVSLTFKVNNDNYKLVRTKDPANLRIFINDEDKSGKGIRDSEKLLADYLPDLTSQLIGSVVILGQGLPQRFTNNTPSGRKEVLEKLSKSDFMIADLKRRIAERKAYIDLAIRNAEDNILADTTKKEMIEAQLSATQDALDKLKLTTVDVYEMQIKLSQQKVDENKVKLDDASMKRDLLMLEMKDAQGQINSKHIAYMEKCSSIESEYHGGADVINSEIATIHANIKNLDNDIKRLKSVKEFCPTCGQRLPDVHVVDTSEKERQLQELRDDAVLAEKKLADVEGIKVNRLAEEKSIYEEQTKELNEHISQLSEEYDNINSIYTNINAIYNEAKIDLERAKLGLENLEKSKAEYEDNIQNFNNELVDLNKNIDYNKCDKDTMEERLAIVNKMSTIVTRDFRGYLLSNVIEFINNKAKEYSKQVFDTDKLDFIIDGNNISISYDSKEYENLSGGEKQKVDLIVQLAIRDMLCTFLGFSCNILVVDELFDNLDDIGCQRVIDLISTKINDVDTIYIVTHHKDISIPADEELVVVKGIDKISRIGG